MARPAGVLRPVLTAAQRRERAARRAMAAQGYDECVTYSFLDREAAASSAAAPTRRGWRTRSRASSATCARRSCPRSCAPPPATRRGMADLALFELGAAFSGASRASSASRSGPPDRVPAPGSVHGDRREVDTFDARADAEAVLARIDAPAAAQVMRGASDWFIRAGPARSASGRRRCSRSSGASPEGAPRARREGPRGGLRRWPDTVPMPRASGPARSGLVRRSPGGRARLRVRRRRRGRGAIAGAGGARRGQGADRRRARVRRLRGRIAG